jgi:large subunit ribosomal protein L25
MQLGDSIRVSDLRLPAGVTTEVDPEEVVVNAQVSRATIEAVQEEELAEALEELAEAAAEEGGEAADGGDGAEGGDDSGGDTSDEE